MTAKVNYRNISTDNSRVFGFISRASAAGNNIGLIVGRTMLEPVPFQDGWQWVSLDNVLYHNYQIQDTPQLPSQRHHLVVNINDQAQCDILRALFDKVIVDRSTVKFIEAIEGENPVKRLSRLLKSRASSTLIFEAFSGMQNPMPNEYAAKDFESSANPRDLFRSVIYYSPKEALRRRMMQMISQPWDNSSRPIIEESIRCLAHLNPNTSISDDCVRRFVQKQTKLLMGFSRHHMHIDDIDTLEIAKEHRLREIQKAIHECFSSSFYESEGTFPLDNRYNIPLSDTYFICSNPK